MITTGLLTSSQSKVARAALGISQSKAALGAGVNRSQLALFEVQKYLLPESKLKALQSYYEDCGYQFDRPAKSAPNPKSDPFSVADSGAPDDSSDTKIIDGYVVPFGLDSDTVESVLDEIHSNDQKIDALAQQRADFDWFSGGPKTRERDEILRLMARNYLRSRQLQGGEFTEAESKPIAGNDMQSVAELVGQSLGLPLIALAND